MRRETITMKITKYVVVIAVVMSMVFFFGASFIFQGPITKESPQEALQVQDGMERVQFQTKDGVTIIGAYWPHEGADVVVLLLHMMPSTKESWAPFAQVLNQYGYAVLAPDLRGHGESVESTESPLPLDYQKFIDAQHQASKEDVDAAINFLRERGFADNRIALVGASIGGNLAIDYLSRNANIRTVAALSPGLDYRGVTTEEAVKNLGPAQSLFIAVAEGDQYAAQSVAILDRFVTRKKEVKTFKGADHGTNLFSSNPSLAGDIVTWLNGVYRSGE